MSPATLSVARATHCVCGARLRWVRYVPVDVDLADVVSAAGLSVLPLDWHRPAPHTREAATANYAVTQGTVFARQITPSRPFDPRVEWGPFNIHFTTCPLHVTAEQLADLSPRRHR